MQKKPLVWAWGPAQHAPKPPWEDSLPPAPASSLTLSRRVSRSSQWAHCSRTPSRVSMYQEPLVVSLQETNPAGGERLSLGGAAPPLMHAASPPQTPTDAQQPTSLGSDPSCLTSSLPPPCGFGHGSRFPNLAPNAQRSQVRQGGKPHLSSPLCARPVLSSGPTSLFITSDDP